MFTPEELEFMPRAIEKLYSDLEWRVMSDIIRRIKINREVTRAADWQIYRLHELGESKEAIKSAIQDALNLTDKEIDKIYEDAIASGYTRDHKLYEVTGKEFIPYAENKVLQQMVKAIKEQTFDTFKNITQSLGFAEKVDGKIVFTELADFYQQTLDAAMVDITSGMFDYNTVLKRTIDTLTNSGLRTIDYASGWSNRVEVAARRAVMTGITQVTGKINEQNAEKLETEYFEVSWHADARPTHQKWQGRVYSKKDLEEVCGLGTGDGLAGWNCRHTYYPFIPGISERLYTDEQLDAMNEKENTPKEWNGKKYTSYEASQKQRKMETSIRAWKRKVQLLKDGGASGDVVDAAKCRYRTIMDEYARFSEAMKMPQQKERFYIGKAAKKKVADVAKSDIIKAREMSDVSTGGKRNEVPLTEEQIKEAQIAARKQGYKGIIQYSDYSNTSFHGSAEGERFCYLVIGTDAYPSTYNAGNANEKVSLNGCMAHEVVGHYETWLKGTMQSEELLDEVQASIRASKFGIGLTQEEREILYEDAMERLNKAGVALDDVEKTLDIWER